MDSDSNQAFIDLLDDPCTEVDIGITEGVMRDSGFSSHAAYVIKVTRPFNLTVERRYRQFFALRQAMLLRWPGVFIPCLPPKHISGNSDLKIVSQRVKYLAYFLNCIAKVDYLFMSQEFQLFLHSNSLDLKKVFEKMEKPTFESIIQRYETVFTDIKPNLELKADLMSRIKDEAVPFAKELQDTQTKLVNIKKDLFKLAAKREEYLNRLGDLYSDALPEFEAYLGSTCQSSTMVLENDPVLREKIISAKTSRAQNYWILYEAVRLQIGQSKAVLQVIHRRVDIERQEQRIRHKIISNQQELSNIKNKKSSLRQFFNSNTDELTRELQQENDFLRKQLKAIQIVIICVNELILRHVIWEFKEKRIKVWRRAFKHMIIGEQELNIVFGEFYKVIAMTT